MDAGILQQQTFAEWIPTCAECGSHDTTIRWYPQTMEKPALVCGHPPNFKIIRNPALPGDTP